MAPSMRSIDIECAPVCRSAHSPRIARRSTWWETRPSATRREHAHACLGQLHYRPHERRAGALFTVSGRRLKPVEEHTASTLSLVLQAIAEGGPSKSTAGNAAQP